MLILNISPSTFLIRKQTQTQGMLEFSIPMLSAPTSFISVWNTNLAGVSRSNQVRLPLQSIGTYDFFVDWGDSTNDTITIWDQAERTHTYDSTGIYTITINGTIDGWRFAMGGDCLKILEIQQSKYKYLGQLSYYA